MGVGVVIYLLDKATTTARWNGIPLHEAKKGDVVEFFGENISVVEVAELCGTISYEILCGISQRVPRIYVEK